MGRELSFLIPELLLASVAMLMIVAEMARAARLVLVLGLAGLTAATLLTLPVLHADTTVFSGTYRIDLISGWAKLILLPGTALALLTPAGLYPFIIIKRQIAVAEEPA